MIDQARQILINAVRGEQIVDTVEVSTPDLSEVLYLTPWHPGFTGQLETGEIVDWVYVPMRVDKPKNGTDLSQTFQITIQDLNEIVGEYIDQIPLETQNSIRIRVRSYVINIEQEVSQVADGPYDVESRNFAMDYQGVAFTAEPQSTAYAKCGERGTIDRTGGLYRQWI